ncbi:uncharacterized protein A4U43_C01F22590 [Asparagus officinalis]|uniref:Uncharacterized protein n=1 Tax=Asparagus officinalis TaxID=4686 RepID=A0A5P1FRY8_ASPOF|nr:uncharacterized protein A4U43_C01F22590 [Asparagus officinalis]
MSVSAAPCKSRLHIPSVSAVPHSMTAETTPTSKLSQTADEGHDGAGGLLETNAGHGACCSKDGDVALVAAAEGEDGGDEVSARGDLDEGRAEGGGDFTGEDDRGLGLVLGARGVAAVEESKPKISCTSASNCYKTNRSRSLMFHLNQKL